MDDVDKKPGCFTRFKIGMQRLVEKAGFLGVLLCASVSSNYKCNAHIHPRVHIVDAKTTARKYSPRIP